MNGQTEKKSEKGDVRPKWVERFNCFQSSKSSKPRLRDEKHLAHLTRKAEKILEPCMEDQVQSFCNLGIPEHFEFSPEISDGSA